jgi:multidrug efflux system outer membrane protein
MSLSIESIVRRWGRWAAPATVLGLLGCASAPPAVPDAQPPASVAVVVAWQAPLPPAAVAPPSQAADLAAWWRVFGDEGLSQIIERALQAHTSVRAAQAALAQARAQRDLTAAATLPGLRAAASAQRGATAQTTSSSFRAGLDASWEVDVFGARGHALEASEADARASAAQLGQARVTLAAPFAGGP